MRRPQFTPERFAGFAYEAPGGLVALAGRLCRKSADSKNLTIKSVLTYPVHDRAGDYIRPEGLDFSSFALDPRVDVEHSLKPQFGGLIVAWCRKSLSRPDAPLAIEQLNLDVDGEQHRLPVATSYFDSSSRASMQCFRLVEEDKLPGVSLEFRPLAGRRLGKSLLEPRDAYEFTRCDVHRYTHCAIPVNPGALTITKSLDALLPIVQTGRLGSEELDPDLWGVLKKSLSAFTPRRVLVHVEKAMADDDQPETVYDDAGKDDMDLPTEEETPAEAPALGGIAALYAKAQALLDACSQNEEGMQSSDSPELRKFAEKMRAKVEAIAEEIKGMADKHDAKLNGTAEPETETPEEPADVDMDTDDDGMLKAIRGPYKVILKAVRAKRFTEREIAKAADAAAADDGNTEADRKARARERIRYARAERIHG